MRLHQLAVTTVLIASTFSAFAAVPALSAFTTQYLVYAKQQVENFNIPATDYTNVSGYLSHISLDDPQLDQKTAELSAAINAVNRISKKLGINISQDKTGEFSLEIDDKKYRVKLLNTTNTNKQTGIYINEDGNYELVVDNGKMFSILPALEAPGAFNSLMNKYNINAIVGNQGQIDIPLSNNSSIFIRPDFASETEDGNTETGLQIGVHSQATDQTVFEFVYDTDTGIAKQVLYPYPVNWEKLKLSLINAGLDKISLNPNGIINVEMDGKLINALPDYNVTNIMSNRPAFVEYLTVGDKNGDGIDDIMVTFPDGKQQLLCILSN